MAQGEPEAKKFKKCIISEHLHTDEFKKKFFKAWHDSEPVKTDELEVIAKPFRIGKISNFIACEKFMDAMKNELLEVKSRRNIVDLYQYEQTCDLVNAMHKMHIRLLYEAFQCDLAAWMEENLKIKLNKKISMSSSCYSDTDFLLCHDDNMDDRRIAFILYLSKNWTPQDGGALDLFTTDENGLPSKVVRSLVPEYNSLVFFEVVDNSYHQVAEVTSVDKSRWTINGWFHGPITTHRRPRPEPVITFAHPEDSDLDLSEWVADPYLSLKISREIQETVERDSHVFIPNYFKPEKYQEIAKELLSDQIKWKRVGPADVRNYELAEEESLPDKLKELLSFFKNRAIFQLLTNYTEVEFLNPKDGLEPRMTIELQRMSSGCYTLLCDEQTINDNCLDPDTTDRNNRFSDGPNDADQSASAESSPYKQSNSFDNGEAGPSAVSDVTIIPGLGCNTPPSSKEDEDEDHEEVFRRILKSKSTKSPKHKKKPSSSQQQSQQASCSKSSNSSPQKSSKAPPRTFDSEDSDVSDIGDYLSDPRDYSCENSDREDLAEQEADTSSREPGTLDVLMQFHLAHMGKVEDTIDYVDPGHVEGSLINIPARDNHLCLVYKSATNVRIHKYVNHYCKGYFYNLVCTYYE